MKRFYANALVNRCQVILFFRFRWRSRLKHWTTFLAWSRVATTASLNAQDTGRTQGSHSSGLTWWRRRRKKTSAGSFSTRYDTHTLFSHIVFSRIAVIRKFARRKLDILFSTNPFSSLPLSGYEKFFSVNFTFPHTVFERRTVFKEGRKWDPFCCTRKHFGQSLDYANAPATHLHHQPIKAGGGLPAKGGKNFSRLRGGWKRWLLLVHLVLGWGAWGVRNSPTKGDCWIPNWENEREIMFACFATHWLGMEEALSFSFNFSRVSWLKVTLISRSKIWIFDFRPLRSTASLWRWESTERWRQPGTSSTWSRAGRQASKTPGNANKWFQKMMKDLILPFLKKEWDLVGESGAIERGREGRPGKKNSNSKRVL